MDISERKQFEMGKKLESLAREFKHWRDESENFKPLQKHHTQIRRITYQLEGIHSAILAELKTVSKGKKEDILSKARELEMDILEVHRIWEFFRSKLVLRSVDWFNPYLVAADEFAWACYEPAQVQLKADQLAQSLNNRHWFSLRAVQVPTQCLAITGLKQNRWPTRRRFETLLPKPFSRRCQYR